MKEFVVNEMFRGKIPPEETRRKFFPLRADYRNIMRKAKKSYKNAIVSLTFAASTSSLTICH